MPKVILLKKTLSYNSDSYEVWKATAVEKAIDCTSEEAAEYRKKVSDFNRFAYGLYPRPDFQLEVIEVLEPKSLEEYMLLVDGLVKKENAAKISYEKKKATAAAKRKETEVERKKKQLEKLKKELEDDPS